MVNGTTPNQDTTRLAETKFRTACISLLLFIFPSQLNAQIMLTRKENDVEELRRRVEEAKIKLGSEMKVCP